MSPPGPVHRQPAARFGRSDAAARRGPDRRGRSPRLSGVAASGRPAARPGLSRCSGHIPAGPDHCQSLAARQRLCPGHSARRRPPVPRSRLGELRDGIARASLTRSGARSHGFGGANNDEMGLFVQRRARRRQRRDEEPARRQGRQPAEMASLGLPVPPGFTITTEVCTYFYANGKTYPPDLKAQVDAALAEVGRQTGRAFGDAGQSASASRCARARAPRCPA